MAATMGQGGAPRTVPAEVPSGVPDSRSEERLRNAGTLSFDQGSPPGLGTCFAGRYLIEKELGRGGMGRVFAGRDLKLRRKVAIKVLAPGVHDDHTLRRFEQEACAAGSLDHANVLAVPDVGV